MKKRHFSLLISGIIALIFLFCFNSVKAQITIEADTLYLDFDQAVPLPASVNSIAEEVKPIVTRDGKTMYFVRAYHEQNIAYDSKPQNEDIWETQRSNASELWSESIHEKTINDEKNNSVIGNGKNGHVFLLNTYQDKKHLKYGIARTKKQGTDHWSHPLPIEIPNLKYQGTFYDFYITHDEKVLLISIKGDDTKGKEDLYVCFNPNNDDQWTEPKNLDSTINTSGFEMSPFLTEDTKYLFFASNGHKNSYGDADIYVSKRLDETWTNWSEPKNLGPVINSEFMDCYFTISDSGEYYFSSNRNKENGLDIYQATLKPIIHYVNVTLTVEVRDKKDSSLLSDVTIAWTENDQNSRNLVTDSTGTFKHDLGQLAEGSELRFTFNFQKENYLKEVLVQNYTLDQSRDINIVEYLDKVEVGMDVAKVVDIENIYFDLDKFDIRTDAAVELDKIVKVLTDNPEMVIELGSHTDCRGNADYNLTLSDNRAKASADYIKQRIPNPERIHGVGYGETQLVNDCSCEGKIETPCSEDQHQENRRTEFKIVTFGEPKEN